MQATLTPYRFVCDVATFTSLFTTTSDGCRIPDTSAFQCCWRCVPYTATATDTPPSRNNNNNKSNNNSAQEGCTPLAYFKSAGSDMALNFTPQQHRVHLDGAHASVLTFVLRPSEYEGGSSGAAPVLARGTLDPAAYAHLPRKSYSVKLRSARGEVVGKFVFALLVQSTEEAGDAAVARGSSNNSSSSNNNSDKSGSNARQQQQQQQARPPPRVVSSSLFVQHEVHHVVDTHTTTTPPPPPPLLLPSHTSDNHHHNKGGSHGDGDGCGCVLEMVVEGVAIKPEAVDLHHPASLLLGGEYELRLRYGAGVCGTERCICTNPREVSFRCQRLSLALAACDDAAPTSASVATTNTTTTTTTTTTATQQQQQQTPHQKLRFSLWENGVQVAGFSLDPHKFRVAPGAWKAYAIPFCYHPTRQAATLDVSIRKLYGSAASGVAVTVVPAARAASSADDAHTHRTGSAVRARHATAADNEDNTTARHRRAHSHTRHSTSRDDNNDDQATSRGSSDTAARHAHVQHLVRVDDSRSAGTRIGSDDNNNSGGGASAPPRPSSRLHSRNDAPRTPPPPPPLLSTQLLQQPRSHTPLRHTHNSSAAPLVADADTRTTAAAVAAAPPRSPPYRAPDNVEAYLESVLARIEQQQRQRDGGHTHSSLVESWEQWQRARSSSRASSRSSSVDHSHRHHHHRHHHGDDGGSKDDDGNSSGSHIRHPRRHRSTSRGSTSASGGNASSSSPVASAYSRNSSVSSITSRRATSPLPTKSFVQYSMLHPYTPGEGCAAAGAMRVRSSFRPRGHTPPRLYAVADARASRCDV